MAISHDSTEVLNVVIKAKYSYESAFKYFLIAEAIGYSLIVLFVSSKSSSLWRLVVILDVNFSAALAIAHVGKKGNSHAGWLPICGQVPKFCDHATGALISGCIAVIIYLVLLLYTFMACSVLGPSFKP
ncbi:hypothetical protein I3843_09G059800 [Carya illinoinensis]|nr:hypothetical protein I3843_09G059800 [Carya illinoinensis]